MGIKELAKLGFERDKERDSGATAVVAQPVAASTSVRQLATPLRQTTAPTSEGRAGRPLDAADLLDRYHERASIIEFDGGEDRARAEARAWNEVAAIWYRQHGEKAPDGWCAGCGEVLGAEAEVLLLPHGERAHATGDYECIIAYGRRWQRVAATALSAIGIPTPAEIAAELAQELPAAGAGGR